MNDLEKHQNFFREWRARVRKTVTDAPVDDFCRNIASELTKMLRQSSSAVETIITRLGGVIDQDTAKGLSVTAALSAEFPETPEFPWLLAGVFLQILRDAKEPPPEIFRLAAGAIAEEHSIAPGRSSSGELMVLLAKYCETSETRVELLNKSRDLLTVAIASDMTGQSQARRQAFLAQCIMDLVVIEGGRDQTELELALALVDAARAERRFPFLDLVEGQVALALADALPGVAAIEMLDRAISGFSSALEHASSDTDCLLGLVNSHILLGDLRGGKEANQCLKQAEHHCRTLLAENPQSAEGWCAIGNIESARANRSEGQMRQSLTDRAIAAFQQALSLDARNLNALQGLGNQALNIAERPIFGGVAEALNRAQEAFEAAFRIDPDNYNARYGLATVWRLAAQRGTEAERCAAFKKSEELFTACIRDEPHRVHGALSLGGLLRERGLRNRSNDDTETLASVRALYDQALEYAPHDPDLLLASANLEIQRLDQATSATELIIKGETLAEQIETLAERLPQSRSPIASYMALTSRVASLHEEIGAPFPAEFVLEHGPKIDRLLEASSFGLDDDRLAKLETVARLESITGLSCYAQLERGDIPAAITVIERGLARTLRRGQPMTCSVVPTTLRPDAAHIHLTAIDREGVALCFIGATGDYHVIRLPKAGRHDLLEALARSEEAYRNFAREQESFRRPRGPRWILGDDETDHGAEAAWKSELLVLLRWLGDALDPLWRFLQEQGVRKITFTPQGLWSFCPLHAAQDADGVTIFERFICSYALQTASTMIRPEVADDGAGPFMVAFANPAYAALEPLPASAREHQAFEMARASGKIDPLSELHQGADARADRLRATLSQRRPDAILHLSCHGQASGGDPDESRVLLADDEAVTIREVLASTLGNAPSLVFLSCCEGSARSRYAIDEAVSLQTAFLRTGARHVIGPLWATPDRLSAELSLQFYDHYLEHGCPRQALAMAASNLRATYGDDAVPVWAGFQILENHSTS